MKHRGSGEGSKRELSRWPYGMGREGAADYIEGRMPAPRRSGSRLVWLQDELEAALRALPQDGDDGGGDVGNSWDDVGRAA